LEDLENTLGTLWTLWDLDGIFFENIVGIKENPSPLAPQTKKK
jgi:hypothetical protein